MNALPEIHVDTIFPKAENIPEGKASVIGKLHRAQTARTRKIWCGNEKRPERVVS